MVNLRTIPIDWKADVTTHLASLQQDLVVPTGTFKARVDLATRKMSGDLVLPEATTQLHLGSLRLAIVTLAMEQTGPVTGSVDVFTMNGEATSTFHVRILAIRPVIAPWINLVRAGCVTRSPVVARLSGKVALSAGSTFTGTYDLGTFAGGGFAVNEAINRMVPGTGNTITAKFSPSR